MGYGLNRRKYIVGRGAQMHGSGDHLGFGVGLKDCGVESHILELVVVGAAATWYSVLEICF